MKKVAIFKPSMINFMLEIRLNNSKEFMQNNRPRYEKAMKEPYYALIEALSPAMLRIDEGMEVRPAKVLSRIFRDTRFSRDKSPYRDHHWIAFRHQGEPRDEAVMFWFEIRVEAVSWGLGFWGENRKAMAILRRRMLSNPDEMIGLLRLLDDEGFVLSGSAYKRMDIPGSLPLALADVYPMRDIYITRKKVDPQALFKPGFEKTLERDFLTLAPWYRLLRGCYELGMAENM